MTAQTILPANTLSSGYDVANSCRFDDGSSDSMTRDNGTPTNLKKFSISLWFKRPEPGLNKYLITGFDDEDNRALLQFSSDQLLFQNATGGSNNTVVKSNAVFRDPSAWYHFCVIVDTTQGTAANRVKMYVNGSQVTSLASSTYPDQNTDMELTDSANSILLNQKGDGSDYNSGYYAEVVVLDGTAASIGDFGEFNSDSPTTWQPINVSGLTFGNNGFYLDFEDSSNLGNDANGGTDFTEANLTSVDQSTDTCTNNFATLNPLNVNTDQGTFSEGNLQLLHGSNAFRTGFASTGASQGKWYCEIKRVTATSFAVGVISLDFKSITPNITYMGGVGTPNLGYLKDGNTSVNGSETSGYASYANGDTLMIAMDLDNGKVYFGKNGTWGNSGDPTSGATGTGARSITVGGETWSFGVSVYNATAQCNFGSPMYAISSGNADGDGFGNFEYAVPSGYYSLNTKNLAEYG